MNIKKALKHKNKLVQKIAEEWAKISTYNSYEEGNKPPYSVAEAMGEWVNASRELVELKAKIHKANVPVFTDIFAMSELKNQIKHLRQLDCTVGKANSGRYGNGEVIQKVASFSVVARDKEIKTLEIEIENIQDKLDIFNAKTEI